MNTCKLPMTYKTGYLKNILKHNIQTSSKYRIKIDLMPDENTCKMYFCTWTLELH